MQSIEWNKLKVNGSYAVNTRGDVLILKTRHIKKDHISQGYRRISLWSKDGYKHYMVHRLVADQFIPNPNKKPFVNHINGRKLDCRVGNLEWCTPKENVHHAMKSGLMPLSGEENPNAKLNNKDIVQMKIDRQTGFSIKNLMEKYGVSRRSVFYILAGKTWATV